MVVLCVRILGEASNICSIYVKGVLKPGFAWGAGRSAAKGRRLLRYRVDGLAGFVFYDCLLATVVTAFTAYGVVDVPCTAVGAKCKGGGYSLVVCTTLGGAGLGLLAFRMCHCCL